MEKNTPKRIAFDFDKTLTYRDSLTGFLTTVKPGLWPRLRYLVVEVLHGFKLVNNDTLKRAAVSIFLKGKTRAEIETAAKAYVQGLDYNQVFRDLPSITEGFDEVYVVTASFEEYIGYVPFPIPVTVVGGRLLWQQDRVQGLERNCYHAQKVTALEPLGVDAVDIFYTDSLSDRPLMNLARENYMVTGDTVTPHQ